ncbi:DUF637 domain-containing protein [Stenotrophomonas panacihumi]|uniref:DUF637 domain-containing protein n=1 Tax=Stenotrophomonas panacihumi TaxID=676599 RepID=UPI000AB928E0|nr:DUF637 domain-containing protein [Stenotrophomonas panacihumi]
MDDGSGTGIQRGVTELQKDGLKEIFDARKVSEQLQLQQVAGELGFQAAGTLAEKYGWAEGSKEKMALHAAVGAAVATLGGGNVLGGAAGAGLNQSLVPVPWFREPPEEHPKGTYGGSAKLSTHGEVS